MVFCMHVVSECCFVSGCPWTFVCKWLQSVVLSMVAPGFLYVSGFGVVLPVIDFLYASGVRVLFRLCGSRDFLYASGFRVVFCLWLLMEFCMQVASKCCFVSGCSRSFVCKWLQSVVLSLDARGFLYVKWFHTVVVSPVAHGFLDASGFRVLFCPRLLMDFSMQVALKCCFVACCSWNFRCQWFQSVVLSLVAPGILYADGFRVLLCRWMRADF